MMLGWLVPRVLALVFPEGVKPLFALAFVATILMVVLSMAVWLGLYLWQGLTVAEYFAPGAWGALWHLMKLATASALIWGPVLVLSVAGLPRHWVEETW
ncbi:hypothetical protein EAT49_10945 [Histidinibacterium lentulum]|uniref:Uncharacterized protein n=2 Tax=Histidinibacterium lentulum TaxID=2480588 RepID=A0A3N2R1D5_9RHOB|nr:hypothetical protein EAT49_10945 [Histidinibacterium lentulum]